MHQDSHSIFNPRFCNSMRAIQLSRSLLCAAVSSNFLSISMEFRAPVKSGVQSAFVVSVFVGFVYVPGNLIQMDFAARMCPATIAGSMFAI